MRNRLRVFLPLTFAISLSFAAYSYGQGTAPSLGVNNTFTATNTFTKPTILGPSTVAMLPAASAYPNGSITVTDGSTSSDCVTGGGTFRVSCISNGTAWTAASGGVGCTVSGSSGNYQINNGSGGCAGALAPAYNTSYGALNNGSTDDATANTNCINGLATNGGTCLLGNNTLWTPPLSWTANNFWENIGLGGLSTIQTNSLLLTGEQRLYCESPRLRSINEPFNTDSGCTLIPAISTSPNPLLDITGNVNRIDNINIAGFGTSGVFDEGINTRWTRDEFVAGTSGALPYESARSNSKFGHWFEDGGVILNGITGGQPSMLFHTTGIGEFSRWFIDGNGIFDESTLYPAGGPDCGERFYHEMLQESVPAYTEPFAAHHTYDLNGCNEENEVYINPLMADSQDAITPMFQVTRTTGAFQLRDMSILGGNPSGPWFNAPVASSVGGVFLAGGSPRNVLGLWGTNAVYTLTNGSGFFSANGGQNGWPGGFGGSFLVGLADPLSPSCTPSNSGGSLTAGSYYVLMAYYDKGYFSFVREGMISGELGPYTITGSSGSLACTYTPSSNSVIAGIHVVIGTVPGQEFTKFAISNNSGSFTITGSGSTTAFLSQMFPSPQSLAPAEFLGFGRGAGNPLQGELIGTSGCTGIGAICPGSDVTPGDTYVAGNFTVNGTCTGCTSGGAVTATGTPASGNLTKFAGATTITNGNLAGDVTTSGTLNTTVVGINGASPPASTPVVGTNASKQIVASTAHNISTPLICPDSSGSGTAQVCNTSPTFTPIAGDTILYNTTTSNTGDVTVNVNSLGAKHVKEWLGTSTLASGDMPANTPEFMTYDGTFWEVYTIGNVPGGTGTVTSVATTSPLGGGTITGAGTLTCTTCVVASSPSAGIAHFAGSTQTVTSSAVLLSSSAQATGQLPIGNVGSAGLSGTSPVAIASTGAISCPTCTRTICSGTQALGTAAISAGTAASLVTFSCSGLLTTDNIAADFVGDTNGVVGYQPSTSGTLAIKKYITANNINISVINNTASTITPGAVTLQLRGIR